MWNNRMNSMITCGYQIKVKAGELSEQEVHK